MGISVLQLIDSLVVSGAETVAVNTANLLASADYDSHLCATRSGGDLEARIDPRVKALILHRRGRFDAAAIARLSAYVRAHEIDILHAHSSSLFVAIAVKLLAGRGNIIWHDHFGRYATEERNVRIYRPAVHRAAAVIAVNQPLADWSIQRLGMPPERVHYIPNFVPSPPPTLPVPDGLHGAPNRRIVCVANFRPQKDHLMLIRAFARVLEHVPDAHLLLVGDPSVAPTYSEQMRSAASKLPAERVHFLGLRADTAAILAHSTIGALSSNSEGLSLSLLEYGMAGLASVSTNVGQCAEVLDGGRCGRLVAAGDERAFADALIALLQNEAERTALGTAFYQQVQTTYSAAAYQRRISAVYQEVLGM